MADGDAQRLNNNGVLPENLSQEHPAGNEQGDVAPGPQSPPIAHNAFASQLEMTSAPQISRQTGPYNMAPMSNALPQAAYRGSHYHHGHQQRYNSTASPPMLPQIPQHMPPYGPSHSMPMANQPYYAQQAPQMHQYYPNGQMSPTQAQSTISSRQSMGFYPNQMMMGHAPAAYYYPQHPQYATTNQPMSPAMAPGQYMPASPTAMSDPRIAGDAAKLSQQQGKFIWKPEQRTSFATACSLKLIFLNSRQGYAAERCAGPASETPSKS